MVICASIDATTLQVTIVWEGGFRSTKTSWVSRTTVYSYQDVVGSSGSLPVYSGSVHFVATVAIRACRRGFEMVWFSSIVAMRTVTTKFRLWSVFGDKRCQIQLKYQCSPFLYDSGHVDLKAFHCSLASHLRGSSNFRCFDVMGPTSQCLQGFDQYLYLE